MNMLDHFEKILMLVKENGLNDLFFQTAGEHLDAASALLQTSPVQTALFALLLERFGEDSVPVNKIAETVKCSKIQLLKYMDDFDVLKKKRLVLTSHNSIFSPKRGNFPEYRVPLDVINSIRNNTEYQCTAYDNLTPEEFFDHAQSLLKAVKNDDISNESLTLEIDYILSRNKGLAFAKNKKEYDLGEGSVLIMFIFCCALLHKDEETIGTDNLMGELREILGYHEARKIIGRLKSRKHKLFVKELIDFDCQNSIADTENYRLSKKAKDEFLSDYDYKEKTKHNGKFFINAENIPVKKLYFGDKIKYRIAELTELLYENNFTSIQKRLEESGMRTGFACIFSGSPGTGKTETAYQIAQKTGRDIMLVDIAETKSEWFGQSEKRIKAVFDRYRGIVKSGGRIPILLFNEADAVLGKRRELSKSRSGPDQTENAIQNIILHEMENLNGILITTTNMTVNLDKAFERRFLYKIEFDKPDTEAKKMMWKNFIPALSDNDAAKLAGEFDFSGGQIENIARKNTVSFILKGAAPNLSALETLCREESLGKNAVRIGFCVE